MIEEITHARDVLGMTHPEIARWLGYSWSSYLTFVSRHPEVGPASDPEVDARKAHEARWAEITRRKR